MRTLGHFADSVDQGKSEAQSRWEFAEAEFTSLREKLGSFHCKRKKWREMWRIIDIIALCQRNKKGFQAKNVLYRKFNSKWGEWFLIPKVFTNLSMLINKTRFSCYQKSPGFPSEFCGQSLPFPSNNLSVHTQEGEFGGQYLLKNNLDSLWPEMYPLNWKIR